MSYRLKLFLAFAAVYIIWGATFFGVQVALKSFPPFLLSALRLLIAGSALSLFCVIRRESLPPLREVGRHIVCGLVIFVGGIVFVVWAQQYISSSLASAIITTPFWFIILDKAQWKFYFASKWIVGGLLLSLMGVIILMSFKQGRTGIGDETMQTIAILSMIAGSGLWVGGSLYLKYQPSATSVYVSTAIQLLSAGVFCAFLSFFTSDFGRFSIDDVQPEGVYSVLYLGIVSSLITFLAFTWLIRQKPPAVVSTYAYVNPLVATLLGWLFANENISAAQLVALGIILTGVLFVNIPRYQKITSAS
ncbi:MAG TPA: EamA family transporter [Cyclobacteriaceae bacterium]|nr:EamA family transporter [Cyclobacteriaceae bacterium]